MKILMFAHYFYPHIGGVERHIEELLEHLKGKEYSFKVITEKFDDNLKSVEHTEICDIYRIGYRKRKFLGLFEIWLSLLKLRKNIQEADIIHIHDVFIWYLPFKFLFPKKPVFITFHGYESFPVTFKAKFIRKVAEQLTNGNICVGAFMKKWYGTKPNIVFYGGVNLNKFQLSPSTNYEFDAIFSSRLDDQTGIVTYLETVKLLKKKLKNFKFLVLGDGKYYKAAEKIGTVRGFVNDPSAYFKISKTAFVSRYLAILEAFATKKLVFAVYDNLLKKDYLEMTPFSKWIVIEKNPSVLADKICEYSKNPKKYDWMIDSAYKWVKKQTWEEVGRAYEKLWGVETM